MLWEYLTTQLISQWQTFVEKRILQIEMLHKLCNTSILHIQFTYIYSNFRISFNKDILLDIFSYKLQVSHLSTDMYKSVSGYNIVLHQRRVQLNLVLFTNNKDTFDVLSPEGSLVNYS